eukprot:CAMPEP_0172834676 /NCGR_PEP_ID=MMETSP1075-20121228/25232_1 /TAXON_ID=2916 /ORGANISM="Ceratium fusus, Strain PA161109" /LENGTH=208 /DNA_ID=CAMNT_0013677613 /DNA_START=92 /DNA_END=718 /DNA_ORIENTATION=+
MMRPSSTNRFDAWGQPYHDTLPAALNRQRVCCVARGARGGGVLSWLKRKLGKGSKEDAPVPTPTNAPVEKESEPAPAPTPAHVEAETAPALAPEPENGTSNREELLKSVFQRYDLDGNGMIDKEELRNATLEVNASDELVAAILERFDTNNDGGIDFPEFKKIIMEAEESCNVENEDCFVLEDPSTWGKLFSWDPNQLERLINPQSQG